MKKRKFILVLIVIVILLSTAMTVNALKSSISVDRQEEMVRIFVGGPRGLQTKAAYRNERISVLNSLNDDAKVKALVVLNSFLSCSEVNALVSDWVMNVERIWLASPGEVGVGTVMVENNNINTAYEYWIEDFKSHVQEKELDDAVINEKTHANYQSALNGNFKIYALEVYGEAGHMKKVAANPDVELVDPHVHPKATEKAAELEYEVRFINIPIRPDNIK